MDFSQRIHTELSNRIMKKSSAGNAVITSTTGEQLYLIVINSRPYEKFMFQFVPDELSYKRKVDYSAINVIARNIPKFHFSGGDASMSFRLDFFAQDDDRSDVVNRVRKLETLTYSDGYNNAPPIVQLKWGNMFRKSDKWLISDFSAKFSDFKPNNAFLPQQAYVDITLQYIADTNPKWIEVMEEIYGQTSPETQDMTSSTEAFLKKKNIADRLFNAGLPYASNPSFYK